MKRIIVVTTLALGLTFGSTSVYAGACHHCGCNYSETRKTVNRDKNAGITFRQGLALALSYLLGFYGEL